MAIGEFDLIAKYFDRRGHPSASSVDLGIGDDCALLAPTPGMRLAVSSDMLVEGRHFLSTVAPDRLGHKALAVNLSDLAACGARPLAFTLALSLPRADERFLAGLAQGMFALADRHACALVGGDTTQGPLNLCITVMGEVPVGQALLRSGAKPGDDVYVSGTLGDARLALEVFRGSLGLPGDAFERVRSAMERPTPRVELGQALRGIASSAIDVSDGLLGDLRHILARSGVGAEIEVDLVPRSSVMSGQPLDVQHLCTLSGGDDYELVFTAAPGRASAVHDAARRAGVEVTRIGAVSASPGVRLVDADGHPINEHFPSFDHFDEHV